jgi:hypothetical protein
MAEIHDVNTGTMAIFPENFHPLRSRFRICRKSIKIRVPQGLLECDNAFGPNREGAKRFAVVNK